MEFHELFTNIDWIVVGGYLLITAWVGHYTQGNPIYNERLFLGGRSLPWQAVSGSILLPKSGLTFIGVPGMIYAAGGDFTYLQWGWLNYRANNVVSFRPRFL